MGLSKLLRWKQLPAAAAAVAGNKVDESGKSKTKQKMYGPENLNNEGNTLKCTMLHKA